MRLIEWFLNLSGIRGNIDYATMSARQRFEYWYAAPIRKLCLDEKAGFIVTTLSVSLLERFLRQKTGIKQATSINYALWSPELVRLFPKICGTHEAEIFWQAARHGLMHQAAFKTKGAGQVIAEIGLHESSDAITHTRISAGHSFLISPTKFSETVLAEIEADFPTFEAPGSQDHPLPEIADSTAAGLSGYSGYKKP